MSKYEVLREITSGAQRNYIVLQDPPENHTTTIGKRDACEIVSVVADVLRFRDSTQWKFIVS